MKITTKWKFQWLQRKLLVISRGGDDMEESHKSLNFNIEELSRVCADLIDH